MTQHNLRAKPKITYSIIRERYLTQTNYNSRVRSLRVVKMNPKIPRKLSRCNLSKTRD